MYASLVNVNKSEIKLTPEHAAVFLGVSDSCSVMDYIKAVSVLIGSRNIHSAYRNGPCIKIYFKDKKYVSYITNAGLVVKPHFTDVEFAIPPASKVIISNVDPIVPDGSILDLLNIYGSLKSGIIHQKFSKDTEYAHIRNDVRYVYMKIKENITVPSKFKLEYNSFLYEIELTVEEPMGPLHKHSNPLPDNNMPSLQCPANCGNAVFNLKQSKMNLSSIGRKENLGIRQRFTQEKKERKNSVIWKTGQKSRAKTFGDQRTESSLLLEYNVHSLQNLETNVNGIKQKVVPPSSVRNEESHRNEQNFVGSEPEIKSRKNKKRSIADMAVCERKKKILCNRQQNKLRDNDGAAIEEVMSAFKKGSKMIPELAIEHQVNVNHTENSKKNIEKSSEKYSLAKGVHTICDNPAMCTLNRIGESQEKNPVGKVFDYEEVMKKKKEPSVYTYQKNCEIHSNASTEMGKPPISVHENHMDNENGVTNTECLKDLVSDASPMNSKSHKRSISCQTTEEIVKQEDEVSESDEELEPLSIDDRINWLKKKSLVKNIDFASALPNKAECRIPVVDLSNDIVSDAVPYVISLTNNTNQEEPLFYNESINSSVIEVSSSDEN